MLRRGLTGIWLDWAGIRYVQEDGDWSGVEEHAMYVLECFEKHL